MRNAFKFKKGKKTSVLIGALLVVIVAFYDVKAQTTVNPALDGSIRDQSMEQEKEFAADKCHLNHDPVSVRPCGKVPPFFRPDPRFSNFIPLYQFGDDYYLNKRCYMGWWWAIKKTIAMSARGGEEGEEARQELEKIPADLKKDDDYSADNPEEAMREAVSLANPANPFDDNRGKYWAPQCRNTIQYLNCFWHIKYGQCQIMWPTVKKVPFARCLHKECYDGCHPWVHFERIKNAVCLEGCYQWFYRRVYCPRMYAMHKWKWFWCQRYPLRCAVWMRIRVPQCCNCLQCWYMGVTRAMKNSSLTLEQKAHMVFGQGGQ